MNGAITANLSITGKRIVIRPWEKKDFKAWKTAEAGMAPPQNDFDYPAPLPKEKNTSSEFLKMVRWNNGNIKAGCGFFCGIFLKKNGAQVGTAGLPTIKKCFQTGEMAYRIFSPFRGQGYGKEAVRTLLKLGFENLKLHRIEAHIDPSNKASIKLVASAGMRLEGLARKKVFERGAWRDLKIYAALRVDYGYKEITPGH